MHIHSISVCTQALLEVSLFSKGELCFLFNLSVADHEEIGILDLGRDPYGVMQQVGG